MSNKLLHWHCLPIALYFILYRYFITYFSRHETQSVVTASTRLTFNYEWFLHLTIVITISKTNCGFKNIIFDGLAFYSKTIYCLFSNFLLFWVHHIVYNFQSNSVLFLYKWVFFSINWKNNKLLVNDPRKRSKYR